MKKVAFLTVAFVLFVFTIVNAQETFKPSAGNFTAEVEFRPLSASPINLTYFRGRYFTSSNFAVRTGINIYFKNQKEEPNEGKDESKQSTFLFGIYPGIEKHFGDMRRLSPYIGGELAIAYKTSKDSYTDNTGTSQVETVYTGAWSNGSERGYFSIGLNFIIGTDFYLSKKLFMGIEMGFGLQSVTDSEVKIEQTGESDVTASEKASVMELGVNFNPAIRLGYSF
ncbi:MAG: hypothetical protein H8D45_13005 [Bacteroidetes bacterium]|nr:hypothetical protein [Bacteroidota bacterium]MBL7102884.1 hypothetical protein [Bacteroidales bacterium]